MLDKCMFLICMMPLFISRTWSTIDTELFEDASTTAETRKLNLASWKLARLTWALLEAIGLADWEVNLADSEPVAEAVSLAN